MIDRMQLLGEGLRPGLTSFIQVINLLLSPFFQVDANDS